MAKSRIAGTRPQLHLTHAMEYPQIIPSILLLQGTVLVFGVPKPSVDSMETALVSMSHQNWDQLWKSCGTSVIFGKQQRWKASTHIIKVVVMIMHHMLFLSVVYSIPRCEPCFFCFGPHSSTMITICCICCRFYPYGSSHLVGSVTGGLAVPSQTVLGSISCWG